MRFDWDNDKNISNQKKHGVSFELACLVFDDPLHVSKQDRHEGGEERWQTIGLVGGIVVVLVAHTIGHDSQGEEIIRIISARKATAHERLNYEQAK